MTTTVFPLSALMSDSTHAAKRLCERCSIHLSAVISYFMWGSTLKYGVFWLSEGMSYSESYSTWYIRIISKQKIRFRIISHLWAHWLVLKRYLNTSIKDIYYSYFCYQWDKPKEKRERRRHRICDTEQTNECPLILINNTPVFRSQQMKNKPYLNAQYASTDLWVILSTFLDDYFEVISASVAGRGLMQCEIPGCPKSIQVSYTW